MIKVTAIGNLGKDAEVKNFGENNVVTFSIASTKKVKGENVTTWLNCQKWNAEKLAQYLTKGTKVAVIGDMEVREHDGKFYTQVNVNEIEFVGGGEKKPANQDAPAEDETGEDLPF